MGDWNELLHTLGLLIGLNRELFWLTAIAGLVTAGITASYIEMSVWKGMLIALVGIGIAAIALPIMHPLWSTFSAQASAGPLARGESEHMVWIGTGAVAALGAAIVGGRIGASVTEAVCVVCISAAGMWAFSEALTRYVL